jgi:hypothetical protein
VLASAAPVTHTLESAMNIELEEVVQDVSDEALEMAAGGAQGWRSDCYRGCSGSCASQSAGLC